MNKEQINNYYIQELDKFYKMKSTDIDKFAECAALAYKDYPLFQYLTNGSYDYNTIKTIIKASIYAMENQVIGFSCDENANAVALFIPPNYTGSTTIPFLLGGGIKLLYMAPVSIFLRLLNYENHAMKLKKMYTGHNSWYLYNITVKPKNQHNGECSKLLKPMCEYFDRTNEDCYLETHNESNIELYEHFGFNLLQVSNIPNTNIKHYSMLRKFKIDK